MVPQTAATGSATTAAPGSTPAAKEVAAEETRAAAVAVGKEMSTGRWLQISFSQFPPQLLWTAQHQGERKREREREGNFFILSPNLTNLDFLNFGLPILRLSNLRLGATLKLGKRLLTWDLRLFLNTIPTTNLRFGVILKLGKRFPTWDLRLFLYTIGLKLQSQVTISGYNSYILIFFEIVTWDCNLRL